MAEGMRELATEGKMEKAVWWAEVSELARPEVAFSIDA